MESKKELIKQLENELSFVRKGYIDAKTLADSLLSRQKYLENKLKSIKEQQSVIAYHELKEKHPDAILLFRCGDFYETYDDDAIDVAKILSITLCGCSGCWSNLAGFPHHALDTYLPKLIRAGKRVAICDKI